MYDWVFVSTGDGARTHTWFPITDFESVASAIPPLLRISRRSESAGLFYSHSF